MQQMAYCIGLVSILATPAVLADSIDPNALIGTWNCSFESNSPDQALVVTSIDTYYANGSSQSHSNLSIQRYDLGLDIVYELTIEGKWSIETDDTLQETITAVTAFSNSNPAVEALIGLKAELMNGQTESAKIVQLNANSAVFQVIADDQTTHQSRCTR